MTRMPWIKLSTDYYNDPRMANLADSSRALFYNLYLLSGQLNANGYLIKNGRPFSDSDIAFNLRRRKNIKKVTIDLRALMECKLISKDAHGYFICDFKRDQIEWSNLQKQWRIRKQRQRKHEREEQSKTSRRSHA